MNTTTPLMKGGFILLVHPKEPKVLLVSPAMYEQAICKDASFRDSREWFRSLRRLFPSSHWDTGTLKAGGKVRSPEYVKQLRKRGYVYGKRRV